MARIKEWTDEEVKRLTKLYTSNKSFDEIMLEFPARTSNAVRLKASRLGLRRPNLLMNLVQNQKLGFQSVDNELARGYLIKCDECGFWIQISILEGGVYKAIRCNKCGSLYEILANS